MAYTLSSVHPEYSAVLPDWILMRDAYKGERQIKAKGNLYLPFTQSQIVDGANDNIQSLGYKAYQAYKQRARFPNFTREAIQTAIGMMHSQPAEIKLPKSMENIMSRRGESLQVLLQRINMEQLLTGRIGLMADLPTQPEVGQDMPYLATYIAERIINWDNGTVEQSVPQKLNLVVLNESEFVRTDGFEWESKDKYRVLTLDQGGNYTQGVFEEQMYTPEGLIAPNWRGQTLTELPFIFINSCDVVADVDDPPLLDLGNMCMAIYRGEADYRQNLHLQGQDTFVTVGGAFDDNDTVRVGAGARLDLPMGGKAEYVGVSGLGLEEQRTALTNLESRASTMGAQTTDSVSRQRESGDSLRIRVAARTADLNQVADTGAEGLAQILRVCAKWMGEDPKEVVVSPNKEFGDIALTGQSMVEIATARNLGWPISAKSMHEIARRRNITKKTWEDEVKEAEEEAGKENFVFAKAETGSNTAIQPNDPNSPEGQSKTPGETTHPSGRTQKK